MIHVSYSNRTERLLDALRVRLPAGRRSPFDPAHLVVPNANVETFVKLGLAQATGIAANLEVRYLRRFVSELVARSHPEVRLVDATLLEGLLIALLSDEAFLADPALAPLHHYIGAASGRPDALDLRRFQLAQQLSVLFDEYGLSRAEMLDEWLRGRSMLPNDAAPPVREIDAWQRRLWIALVGPGGIVDRRAQAAGQRWVTLSAFFQRVDPAKLALPPALHVFGISYVARAFQRVLQAVAQRTELYVYTLNPCMEFWEDIDGARDRDRFPRRADRVPDLTGPEDPFQLESAAGDTPALRLWGRPGRENVRLLNELSECDFTPLFDDPLAGGRTLLAELQHDILVRAPERAAPDPALDADDSLQILECPGLRREAEIIASEIWKLVAADPSLRFNEIAVILPSSKRDAYQTHLSAVFREMHELPHAIVDLPLTAQSRVVEAIELLLELPFGELGRQDLLRLVTHPAVMSRFPDATPEQWLGWCDALGVVHGADHEDHRDTYIERDILNWDQGVKRLTLGGFMTGRGSGPGSEIADAPTFELGGGTYVPEEVPQGSLSSAAGFALLVRSLIADARFASHARLGLPQWIRFLRGFVSSVIGTTSDEDQRVLDKCEQAIEGLEALDLDDREVSYRIPYELAKAALGALSGSRGQYLADGVVVASFVPMRAIPFKVMFLAGLGEGQFPSAERANHLDLRLQRRRAGDVRPRERDKYMFLEALLCTRQRLYVSYVSREALTGDPLAPSSVVVELKQILERGHRTEEALKGRVYRKFPLRRHDDTHTLSASQPAEREARARALGQDLRRHLGGAQLPDLATLRAALPANLYAALSAQLGLCEPPHASSEPGVQVINLRLSALRKFLECPLQGSARYLLGMRDEEDDDVAARTDEAFATSRLDLMVGLRQAFWRALERGAVNDDAALAGAYEAFQQRAELLGNMPTGLFGAVERKIHLSVLRGWRDLYRELAKKGPARPSILRFGGAEEHARVDRLLDPLVLPIEAGGKRYEVRLHGKTETVLDAPAGSLMLINAALSKADAEVRKNKESLKGFLDHVAQAAAGVREDAPYTAFVANVDPDNGPVRYERSFAPLSRESARAYLGTLLADLLSGVHAYLLPCDAVFQQAQKPGTTLVEHIEKLREKEGGSSRFGPVPNPERFAPPDEATAQAMVKRRFGPFFELPLQLARGARP
jgi:exodeoxyribonuclease V gamma subunit